MATRHSNDHAIQLSLDTPGRSDPLTGFPEPPGWMRDALCASTDPKAFFPEKGGSTREAKAVCTRCPVAAECLDWALAGDERFGIWGGLSERERRKLSRTLTPVPVVGYRGGHLVSRVRDWAVCQGIPVNLVGNLPRAVTDAYLAAHPEYDHLTAIHDTKEPA